MPTNPTSAWNLVPVFGFYFVDDQTPETGTVNLTLSQRITRVDGRVIYPEGAKIVRTIGQTDADSVTRDAVRAAWRAADQLAQGGAFDGAAWDAWWTVMLTGAVFAGFPAADDPDIVQRGYQVQVQEKIVSGVGKLYFVQPLLTQLALVPPGINLGLIEVPPGSPTVPAPIYAKGMAGGVAALDVAGDVVDARGVKVGTSGAATTSASALTSGTLDVLRLPGNIPVALLAADVASQAELDAVSNATASAIAGKVDTTDARLSDQRTPSNGTVSLVKLTATGTASASTFLRGDNTWGTPVVGAATTDAATLSSGTLPPARIGDGSVTAAKLVTAVQTSLGKADSALQTAPVASVAGRTGTVVLVKADVGLGSVDNTADTAKPVSAAVVAALGLKVDNGDARLSDTRTPTNGTVSLVKLSATGAPSSTTFLRGDNTWGTPVVGAATTDAAQLTSGILAPARIGDSSIVVAKVSATGTASATTYLRGDGSWSTPAAGGESTTDASLLTSGILNNARLSAVPAAALAAAVQTSLGKADSSLQSAPAASAVPFTASGSIIATTVQSAIAELDSEAVARARAALLPDGGNSIWTRSTDPAGLAVNGDVWLAP